MDGQPNSGSVSESINEQSTLSETSESTDDHPKTTQDQPIEQTSNPVTNPQSVSSQDSEEKSSEPKSDQDKEDASNQHASTMDSGKTADQPATIEISAETSSQPRNSQVSGESPDQPQPSSDVEPTSRQPPSYNSIYGRIREARTHSTSNVEAAKSMFSILSKSMGCTILLAVILAVPISMIVIGSLYLNDCPAQRLIPIYLIVCGCFTIVSDLISLIVKCKSSGSEEKETGGVTNICSGIIGCFLFAWFICGNYWIYSTYGVFTTERGFTNYCHPTLMYYSFWLLTVSYILIGLTCVIMCLGAIVMTCCAALCFGNNP